MCAVQAGLGADPATRDKYRELTPGDLYTDTKAYDTTDPQSYRLSLPWFWMINVGPEVSEDRYIADCKLILTPPSSMRVPTRPVVFRLRWIHARLGLSRVEEEIIILQAEMHMCYTSYKRQADEWRRRAGTAGDKPGAVAFARGWADMWDRYAERARTTFEKIVSIVSSSIISSVLRYRSGSRCDTYTVLRGSRPEGYQ